MEVGLDYLIVEGVMGLLTGSSRDGDEYVPSTMGFIKRSNSGVILVASANYDGVEGAMFRLRAYIKMLTRSGVKLIAVILNNAYHGANEDEELGRFRAELNGESIPLLVVDSLMVMSKPEELIDLGDYEEAALRISELICEDLMRVLSRG